MIRLHKIKLFIAFIRAMNVWEKNLRLCFRSGLCVCLCLYRCVQNISISYERIFIKIFTEVEHGPGTNGLDFGGTLNPLPYFASKFSRP